MNAAGARSLGAPGRPAGRERLTTMVIFALLVHGLVILGVGFVALAPRHPAGSAVNVTLANSRKASAPRHANTLARVNQRGPGNTRHRVLSRPAPGSRTPFPDPGYALATRLAAAFPNPVAAKAVGATRAQRQESEIITTRARSARAVRLEREAGRKPRPTLRVRLARPAARRGVPRIGAVELPRLYGRHARHRARSVNALAAVAAPYLLAWQRRIERVGTAQFTHLVPTDVHSGHLTLAVTIAADGSVHSVAIVKRSHHALLDAAALKIIHLAAPFPPFPATLAAQATRLTFSYRWNFIRGQSGAGVLGLGGQ